MAHVARLVVPESEVSFDVSVIELLKLGEEVAGPLLDAPRWSYEVHFGQPCSQAIEPPATDSHLELQPRSRKPEAPVAQRRED